jgi:hypothetical protein
MRPHCGKPAHTWVVSDLWELLTGLMPGRHGFKLHELLETVRNIVAAEALLAQQPWRLVLPSPASELTPQLESIMSLSNGYLGVRGTVEEGVPDIVQPRCSTASAAHRS